MEEKRKKSDGFLILCLPITQFCSPQDGVGTRKYSNGNLYEGSFSEGEASGEGTMRYVNG